jgi:antitoxin YqcF
MSPVKEEYKEYSSYISDQIGGDDIDVVCYDDESGENEIDIYTNKSEDGTVASTIGLMEIDQSVDPKMKIYAEILMDDQDSNEFLSSILSTIAFFIMKEKWKIAPGVILKNVIEMYIPDLNVKHVMFIAPFQWDDDMLEVHLSTKKIVYPLLAVPITERESKFVIENGSEALEKIWIEKDCDILNWKRKEVL